MEENNQNPTQETVPVQTEPVVKNMEAQQPIANPTTQTPIEPMPTTPPVAEPKPVAKKPKVPSKFMVIGGVVILILIVIAVAVTMLGRVPNVGDIIPNATEEPTATPTPTPAAASPYANDPDVLSIKDAVGEFEKKLNSTSIREDTLRIPVLEWDVSFE